MHTLQANKIPHLDKRLATAASLVRPGQTAADIGCDHGKLSAFLACSGQCPHVIAADIRPLPLQKAEETCLQYHCMDKISLRLGGGLSVLQPGEATQIIIAGMGAQTVCEILDEAPWVRDSAVRLILVPATKHSELRRWLARGGFALEEDILVEEAGRLYAIMQASFGATPREPAGIECILGKTAGQPLADAYRAAQTKKLRKYALGAPAEERVALTQLIGELER